MTRLFGLDSSQRAKPTFENGANDRHGAFAEIGQQQKPRVQQQLLFIDRLIVSQSIRFDGIHKEGKQIAIHRRFFVRALALAQNREALWGNVETRTHEIGETGDLGDDIFVVGVVEEEHAAVVSEPIASLLGETIANHLVDQVGELGSDGVDHFGEACA